MFVMELKCASYTVIITICLCVRYRFASIYLSLYILLYSSMVAYTLKQHSLDVTATFFLYISVYIDMCKIYDVVYVSTVHI